jgi:hypothetical protein
MQNVCRACSKPLTDGGEFCPFCGTKVLPSSTTSAINDYIHCKVNQELSARLKDENSLVREIGDKAEDVVWRRLKHYGVMAGVILSCILGIIAFVGINTIDGISKKVEPIANAAVQKAEAAKRTIDETASKVNSVKASLDNLSTDVATQTKRVDEKSGEITRKLQGFDAAMTAAEKRGEEYQVRSDELSHRLDTMTKALDLQAGRVTQVSKQVDDVSIRQVYPNLGQKKFVTFNGSPWKGVAGKLSGERWVDIFISTEAIGDYSGEQIQRLSMALKESNYTPLLGMMGVGGPYNTNMASAGNSPVSTAVFYFKKGSEQDANSLSAMISKLFSIKDLKSQFVNTAAYGNEDERRFIIEQSGDRLSDFSVSSTEITSMSPSQYESPTPAMLNPELCRNCPGFLGDGRFNGMTLEKGEMGRLYAICPECRKPMSAHAALCRECYARAGGAAAALYRSSKLRGEARGKPVKRLAAVIQAASAHGLKCEELPADKPGLFRFRKRLLERCGSGGDYSSSVPATPQKDCSRSSKNSVVALFRSSINV